MGNGDHEKEKKQASNIIPSGIFRPGGGNFTMVRQSTISDHKEIYKLCM